MTSCPSCGTGLPEEAKFCRNCGESVGTSCSQCGTAVTAGAAYCPSCGSEIGTDSTPATQSDSEALQLRSGEFARRISGDDLQASGLLNRLRQKEQITIEAGNRALVLKNGSIKGSLGPGKHTLDSVGRKLANLRTGDDYTVVLISDGNTVVTLPIETVRTASGYPIGVTVDLVVSIADPEGFVTSLMADRELVTADHFERLLGDSIRNELEATISQYDHDELYGNRNIKRKLLDGIETQCGQTFSRAGLELVEIAAFDYDDDRDEIRQGKKNIEIRAEKEDLSDRESELDRRERERETEDAIHEAQQRVREETTAQAADHEIASQEIEQEHEREDMERRHTHTAERETVEHEQAKKTTKTEGEVERRDLEHEQDMEEMSDLMDIKAKKDQQKLDREEREQDLDMRADRHEVEVEKERLQARDDVDLETLASMDSVDEAVSELAEMEQAADLSPEQLEALGAKDSDELAKARQEAHNADKERERVADQKEFREEMTEMMDESMDRIQETTESAMDNMGETGRAAAEDTSDNVIVSDTGSDSSGSGDTTIVQGGSGGRSDGGGSGSAGGCPDCGADVSVDDEFCTSCGADI